MKQKRFSKLMTFGILLLDSCIVMNLNNSENRFVFSRYLDLFFIVLPVSPGLVYLIFDSISDVEMSLWNYVIFIFLAETHFASSLLFFNANNVSYFKNNRRKMIYKPIVLISFYVVIGLVNLESAIYLGAVASTYHVTKQSVGIFRVYRNKPDIKFELLIWITSAFFISVGFLRFYASKLGIEVSSEQTTKLLSFGLAFLILGICRILSIKGSDISLFARLASINGCLIYFPYLFVSNPLKGAIIGVSCHWLQYLAINFAVYVREYSSKIDFIKNRNFYLVLGCVLILSIGEKSKLINQRNELILLVPLSIQFLHYYYDSIIWKKSDPYIKENVFRKLYKTVK